MNLAGNPLKTTDLRSYPSHRFAAGPSRSRATGGYASETHIPVGKRLGVLT